MEYKNDCPGCGRICTLTIKEVDGKYFLRGNTCNTGKHNAMEIWSFLNEDNLVIDEPKKEKKKGFGSLLKLLTSSK